MCKSVNRCSLCKFSLGYKNLEMDYNYCITNVVRTTVRDSFIMAHRKFE